MHFFFSSRRRHTSWPRDWSSDVCSSHLLLALLDELADLLEEELKEVRKFIKECKEILGSKPRRLKILKEELSELAHGFGDERRTEIVADQGEFSIEDLIAEEDMVITVSHAGYIKRLPVTAYRRQRRGGKGVISAHTKEDDWVEHLFIASTHDYVMFFTQQGQCYWLKVHEIPQAARAARGKPILSCVAMKPDERLAALVPVREFSEDQYLLFATTNGVVKKTRLSEFGNPRSVGIRAINIEKGDELIDVQVTDGRNDIVLATRHGMSIRFHEKDVRDMGRTATGVKGIELDKKDHVIDVARVVKEDDAENGDADDEEGGAPSKPGSPKSAAKRPGKKKKKKP